MRKSLRRGLLALAVVVVAFSAGMLTLMNSSANDNSHAVMDYSGGFVYTPPPSRPFQEPGRLTLSGAGAGAQEFALQGRFFDSVGDVTGSQDYLALRPLFSHTDMERYVWGGHRMPTVAQENLGIVNTTDFGVIMLDDTRAGVDNFLVFELTNLRSRGTAPTDTWFSHTPSGGQRQQWNHSHTSHFIERAAYTNAQIREEARANPNRLAFNNQFTYVGMFDQEGYYRIRFAITVDGVGTNVNLVLEFAFYIVHRSNYEQIPQINTVSGGEATPTAPVTRRGNSNDFFYNFAGPSPYVRFNEDRFNWELTSTSSTNTPIYIPGQIQPTPEQDGIYSVITFEQVGQHRFSTEMVFEFGFHNSTAMQRQRIRLPHFSGYDWNLTIFGYQAYFQEFNQDANENWTSRPAWFGGREWRGESASADITRRLPFMPIASIPTTIAGAEAHQTWLEQNWANAQRLLPNGFRPAETNSPPVQFFGNASFFRERDGFGNQTGDFLSQVSLLPRGSNTWERLDFDQHTPLQTAGEYIVTLYYNFAAATHGIRQEPFIQVFHFRIVDITDIQVATMATNGTISNRVHVNEFIQRRLPIPASSSFVLLFSNGLDFALEPSPFSTPPRVQMRHTNFAGQPIGGIVDNFQLLDLPGQRDILGRYPEGNFEFQIFYGNSRQARATFTVTVDNSPIGNFNLLHNGGELLTPNLPNVAIVGAGGNSQFEVDLTWGLKESGLGFTSAVAEFFPLEHAGASFVQSTAVNSARLNSPYNFLVPGGGSPDFIPLRVLPIDEAGETMGWRLSQTFHSSGLYIIRIMDVAGNESIFILVIDNTPAAFAQNPLGFDDGYEMDVNMSPNPTSVGFGDYKVLGVPAQLQNFLNFPFVPSATATPAEPIWDALVREGVLSGTSVLGLAIPMKGAEVSQDLSEGSFRPVTANNGRWVTLDEDGYFIFRSTDVLGNVSYYYVFVNSDPARGVVLEDDTALIYDNDGNISPEASVVRPGGISNRTHLGFTFMQSRFENHLIGGNDGWVVDRVEMAFYPMDTSPANRFYWVDIDATTRERRPNLNYPFAPQRSIHQAIYNRASAIMADVLPGQFLPQGQTRRGTIFLPINHAPSTPAGVYVITRFFDPLTVPSADWSEHLVRNHFVIVDNNPIISDASVFESDMRLSFGTPPRIKEATHQDFQTFSNREMSHHNRDLVIQTNSVARVVLPLGGTKYGHRYDTGILPNPSVPWSGVVELGSSTLNIAVPEFASVNAGQVITTNRMGEHFASLELGASIARYVPNPSENLTGQFENITRTNGTLIDQTDIQSQIFRENGIYRVSLTDGSGGLRWQQFGAGGMIPDRANRSQILFEIVREGSDAVWRRNDITMHTGVERAQDSTRIVATQFDLANDTLSFRYTRNNPRAFFADVAVSVVTRNGVNISGQFAQGSINTIVEQNGSATVFEYSLSNLGIAEGDHWVILLDTQDSAVGNNGILRFEMHIDNTRPERNLENVQSQDTIWRMRETFQTTNRPSEETFIHRIPLEFEFVQTSFLDSNTIQFQEVNQNRMPIQTIDGQNRPFFGPRSFNYNTPFYQEIGMERESNQNRFFRIIETDLAGNVRSFYVNVRGEGFVDTITADGLVNHNNLLLQVPGITALHGTDVELTWVQGFWDANPFFTLQVGMQMFRRLSNVAETAVVNDQGFNLSDFQEIENVGPADFIRVINTWLAEAREGHTTITLNNGFGNFITLNLFQIASNTHMAQLSVTTIPGTNNLNIEIPNWSLGVTNSLPQIFRDANLLHLTIQNRMNGESYTTTIIGGQYTMLANGVFSAREELVLTLRDSFGRQTRVEHNGEFGNHLNFRYLGGFRPHGGINHTGDANGVEVTFTTRVHTLTILRDGLEVMWRANEFRDLIEIEEDGDLTRLVIAPPVNAHERWQVLIHSQATGRLVFGEVWYFYTVLPILEWTNLSGDSDGIDIQPFPFPNVAHGALQINLSGAGGGLFGAVISFTRTFPNPNFDSTRPVGVGNQQFFSERETIRRGARSFTLGRAGQYVIDLDNNAFATRQYIVEITDVDNTTYNTYFRGERLRSSPVALPYTHHSDGWTRNIPHYFVIGFNDDVSTLSESGLHIVPSLNYPRELIGRLGNQFYDFIPGAGGHGFNTYIYALRAVGNPNSATLFMAVTAIPPGLSLSGIQNTRIATTNQAGGNAPTGDSSGLHMLFTAGNIPTGGLFVSLAHAVLGLPLPEFNLHSGNVFFVDYFYNRDNRNPDGSFAQPCGTFRVGERLRIDPINYGIFTFVVRDWAGNRHEFVYRGAGGEDQVRDHFTIINLARPPLKVGSRIVDTELVDGDIVMDGMVYNDQLVIDVMDIPFTLNNTSHMFISRLEVRRDGVLLPLEQQFIANNRQEMRTRFTFSVPGTYEFSVTYRYSLAIDVRTVFRAQLVSTVIAEERFHFSGSPNTEVTNVTFRGANITRRFGDRITELTLTPETGEGTYVVTVIISGNQIRGPLTRTFAVSIVPIRNIRTMQAVTSNVSWGGSTTRDVLVNFNPFTLWVLLGEGSTLTISRGNQVIFTRDFTEENAGTDWMPRTHWIEAEENLGRFQVTVRNSRGSVAFSEAFEITAGIPTGLIFVIIAGIGLAIAGVVIFLWMRNRMRVR